jgi:hypothetical protein
VLGFGGEPDDLLLIEQRVQRYALGTGCQTLFELLAAGFGFVQLAGQIGLGDLEPAHGGPLLLQVDEGFQAVFSLPLSKRASRSAKT